MNDTNAMNQRDNDILKNYKFKAGLEGVNQLRRAREVHNFEHQTIVEAGGGEYVPGRLGNLVLFNSPATRSTLALPEEKLTPEAVRAHIAESNAKFGL